MTRQELSDDLLTSGQPDSEMIVQIEGEAQLYRITGMGYEQPNRVRLDVEEIQEDVED